MGPVNNPYARKSNDAPTNPYLRKTSSSKFSNTLTGSTQSDRSKISKSIVKNGNSIAKGEVGISQVHGDMNRTIASHRLSKTERPTPLLTSSSLCQSSPQSKPKKTVSSTPPKSSNAGPFISRKVTPPAKMSKTKTPTKRHVTASYKSKLKKEIQALRRQKEHSRILKKQQAAMAILEEERKQKLAAKLQKEKELLERHKERQKMKEERRLAKLRLHEEKKERLVKDLEMRAKIEKEKLEQKRLMLEEKEKAKLRKQQEREEKKHIEAERKRMEKEVLLRRHMAQYNPFYVSQVLGPPNNQAQLRVESTFGNNTAHRGQAIITNSSSFQNERFQHLDAEMASTQVGQSKSKEILSPNVPHGSNPTLTQGQGLKSDFGTTALESNSLKNYTNTLQPYKDSRYPNKNGKSSVRESHIATAPKIFPYNPPSSLLRYENVSYAPTTAGIGKQNLSATPVPCGIQMAQPTLFYSPYSLSNFKSMATNYPYSITHLPSVMRTKKAVPKKSTRTSAMIIHKDPLAVPSPFVKSHHLLSFDIVIIKEGGESFGVELRYLSKGTLVSLEPQLNQSTSSLTSVENKITQNSNGVPKSEVCISSTLVTGTTREESMSNGKGTAVLKEVSTVRTNNIVQSANTDTIQRAIMGLKATSADMVKGRVEMNIECEEEIHSEDVSVAQNHSSHRGGIDPDRLEVVTTESDRMWKEQSEETDGKVTKSRTKESQCRLKSIKISREEGQMSGNSDKEYDWEKDFGNAETLTFFSPKVSGDGTGFPTSSGLEPFEHQEGQSSEASGDKEFTKDGELMASSTLMALPAPLQHQEGQGSEASGDKECTKDAEVMALASPIASSNVMALPVPLQHQEGKSSEASGDKECTKDAEVMALASPMASSNVTGLPVPLQHQEGKSSEASGKEDSNPEIAKSIAMAKPKRKRINVGVMSVLGAAKQNKRASPGIPQERLLQTSDIILAVNGKSVSGMTFQEACGLFSKCSSDTSIKSLTAHSKTSVLQKDDDENSNRKAIIKCTLTVAREKKVSKILKRLAALKQSELILPTNERKTMLPLKEASNKLDKMNPEQRKLEYTHIVRNIPFVVNETSNSVASGEFTSQELRALVQSIKELELASLITLLNENILVRVKAMTHTSLQHRYPSDLLRKWVFETTCLDTNLMKDAITSWKEDWTSSQGSKETSLIEYIPNSHRSEMRSYPRPPRGCKCGGVDHNFVNDPKCFLYKNLFKLVPEEYQRMSNNNLRNTQKIQTTGLGVIGSAHAHRLQKRNDERKAAELEAKFVNHMEEIQIRKLKMAIFAPRLHCVMLLSAIAEVVDQFHKQTPSMVATPLHRPNKKQKVGDVQPSLYCLAKILCHISKTWGHLYKEPGVLEYAW